MTLFACWGFSISHRRPTRKLAWKRKQGLRYSHLREAAAQALRKGETRRRDEESH